MATSLDTISGIGANARKLAKLLQAKAPEGHMLAYINPREAALLKAHGGSGKPEPETGIPSFEETLPQYERTWKRKSLVYRLAIHCHRRVATFPNDKH